MASKNYNDMLEIMRANPDRWYSSKDVSALLNVKERRAWALINAAHGHRRVIRRGKAQDFWRYNMDADRVTSESESDVEQSCGTCRFCVKGSDPAFGWCIAHPPTPVFNPNIGRVQSEHPDVLCDEHWCGEWSKA